MPAAELGSAAVDLLLGAGPAEPGLRTLPVELTVRRSTAEPGGGAAGGRDRAR
ncbi:hypothetical protein [Occultella aeris]|uniref:hypothetical protein n=1 Tax=Occultella aeris TaxID=2761496 RepID=UPI0038CD9249